MCRILQEGVKRSSGGENWFDFFVLVRIKYVCAIKLPSARPWVESVAVIKRMVYFCFLCFLLLLFQFALIYLISSFISTSHPSSHTIHTGSCRIVYDTHRYIEEKGLTTSTAFENQFSTHLQPNSLRSPILTSAHTPSLLLILLFLNLIGKDDLSKQRTKKNQLKLTSPLQQFQNSSKFLILFWTMNRTPPRVVPYL